MNLVLVSSTDDGEICELPCIEVFGDLLPEGIH